MSQPSPILITGGAGFIGSHTCLVLLQAGYRLVVLDNFANSTPESLERVVELVGGDAAERLTLLEGDIRRREDLERAFDAGHQLGPNGAANGAETGAAIGSEIGSEIRAPIGSAIGSAIAAPIAAVVHFAGLKAVAESTAEPLRYWDVNVAGSRLLLEVMQERGCRTLVFSSSATVYGMPERVPIPETADLRPINPYGHTKAAVEQLLADVQAAGLHGNDPQASGQHVDGLSGSGLTRGSTSCRPWRIARLRYFNPVGAHPSGRIGEDPLGEPSNLFPLLGQVALGRRERLEIYGDDWPTADGTGERDFIHVMDLAEGHLAALKYLENQQESLLTLNLGSGTGHTVKQVVRAYEQACGRTLATQVVGRRAGDAACSVADPQQAERLLGWRCQRDLQTMCEDSWRWQQASRQGDLG